MTVGEISPSRRSGIFDGESCLTEAVHDCGSITVFGMLGVSDDDDDDDDSDDDEDDREDWDDGVDGDSVGSF